LHGQWLYASVDRVRLMARLWTRVSLLWDCRV